MMQASTMKALGKSIIKAQEYLVSARCDDKLWRDFSLKPGESDEWVSGYVGSVLSETGNNEMLDIARETWNVLGWKRLNGHGGWAYNSNSLEDADSTLWCLRLANNLGVGDRIRAQMARDFILQLKTPRGGLNTYHKSQLAGGVANVDVSGWTMDHVCVSAAAAVLPQFNKILCGYLSGEQSTDGSWKAYWWVDDIYATAFAIEALSIADRKKYQEKLDKAKVWIIDKFDGDRLLKNTKCSDGSAFATALGLRLLFLLGGMESNKSLIVKIVSWLEANQNVDGSWASSALMRVPPMHLRHPEEFEYAFWEQGMDCNWGVVTMGPISDFYYCHSSPFPSLFINLSLK